MQPPTPLPPQLPINILELSPDISNAYPNILRFEQSARTHSDSMTRLIYARILGYLLLYGPSDEARKTVAREVVSCVTEDQLQDTGKLYFDHYICAFKKYTGPTPVEFSHSTPSTRHSFDDVQELIGKTLEQPPKDHSTAKRRALARDGYRCVLTGHYDAHSVKSGNIPEEVLGPDAVGPMQCAHILDASINQNLDGQGGDKKRYAATVWAIMDRFGYKDIAGDLNGKGVHRLENILTLDPNVHYHFDTLTLWLEPTDEPHLYRVVAQKSIYLRGCKTLVKLTTANPENLPLPSPEYLEIHAACAKIAHVSGAGEYIDQISRDLEDMDILSEDGTSAELLDHPLSPFSHETLVR